MDGPRQIRLAEMLGTLSLVTDLARGHPPEEAMRACLLATQLATLMNCSPGEISDVYYMTLLRYIGCTATSHELAGMFAGNDVAVRAKGDITDFSVPREAFSFLVATTGGVGSAISRAMRVKAIATEGARADCEVGTHMARRFGLPPTVVSALADIFERWDGKGAPARKRGEAAALPARFSAVAFAAIMFGPDGAAEAVRRWSSRILDPSIAQGFLRHRHELSDASSPDDALAAVLTAEPSPRLIGEQGFDDVSRAFGQIADLKSPYFQGHSAGVATLAESAGRLLGLSEDQAVTLRRAGLLHDVGRAGVPTGVWEKRGALSVTEWEQVRLHPYHSERILSRAPSLAPLAKIAGLHHERQDGSGYPHGALPAMLDRSARVLAAADAFHSLTEERPHRPSYPADAAAVILEEMALDRDAIGAVLEAVGRPRTPRKHASGLTEREIEVLRLVVRGRSEKQIAKELFISRSTVHTHIVHIYEKAGVSTRAGAAVYAMENDLIDID